MKQVDQGFVLYKIPYSETSLVVKIFSKTNGLISFLVQGGKKKYNGVLQVGNQIEFSFFQKKDELAKLYEPSLIKSLYFSQADIIKTSYLQFISESLSNVLVEKQEEPELYNSYSDALLILTQETSHNNFLIFWYLTLIENLGITPNIIEKGEVFSFVDGEIYKEEQHSKGEIKSHVILLLCEILAQPWHKIKDYSIKKEERKALLLLLIDYIIVQIPSFKKPKSLQIYQEIWYS